MKGNILFILLCVTVTIATDTFEQSSTKIALGVYGECSNSEDFYVCLKKKAITFLDRLGRAEKFDFGDSVKLVRASNAPVQKDEVTEAKLDEILPRSLDAKNAALSEMLSTKVGDFLGSRTIEISLPRAFSDDDEAEDVEDSVGEGRLTNKLLL